MDGQESKTLKNWHSLKREPAAIVGQITERSLCHGCNNKTATLQKPRGCLRPSEGFSFGILEQR